MSRFWLRPRAGPRTRAATTYVFPSECRASRIAPAYNTRIRTTIYTNMHRQGAEKKRRGSRIRRIYVAHKTSSLPANRLRHSTDTDRSLLAYLVCNVEYSHLPNSARTELLHEEKTWRYTVVRYCIHFSDDTHCWLQTEMRSRSVTVVVCIRCLV